MFHAFESHYAHPGMPSVELLNGTEQQDTYAQPMDAADVFGHQLSDQVRAAVWTESVSDDKELSHRAGGALLHGEVERPEALYQAGLTLWQDMLQAGDVADYLPTAAEQAAGRNDEVLFRKVQAGMVASSIAGMASPDLSLADHDRRGVYAPQVSETAAAYRLLVDEADTPPQRLALSAASARNLIELQTTFDTLLDEAYATADQERYAKVVTDLTKIQAEHDANGTYSAGAQ